MTSGCAMSDDCVVVIDDQEDVLEIIRDVLEMEGFETVCLPSPAAVRQWARSSPVPRLILMDIMLPGMSGIDLARELRAQKYLDTPIIAMSASSPMLATAARSAVFEDTISKPFDVNALMKLVEHYAA